MFSVWLMMMVAGVSSLPDPRTHGGSRHCSLVRKLVADNPAMCFSEPECGQQCRTVESLQCETVQDRQCRTVNQNKCFDVQQQVGREYLKYLEYKWILTILF